MFIVRGTTPDIIATIPATIEPTTIAEIWFSLSQAGKLIAHKDLSCGDILISEDKILIRLTQQETLALQTYTNAQMGLRLLLSDGTAMASRNVCMVDVHDVIEGGIIYEPLTELPDDTV